MDDCPCGSGMPYAGCCGRYLDERVVPVTALALMRSRYTAYTRKNREYILQTWHPETRPQAERFEIENGICWTGLTILSSIKGGSGDDTGTVEFIADYIHSGKSGSLREKSRFVRQEKKWFYLGGETPSGKILAKAKVGRNAPCPCGSGRKYKKCCLSKS